MTRRRALALATGFGVTALTALALTPRRHEATLGGARLADVIPQRVGAWGGVPGEGLVLPVATGPTDVYDQVLTRAYIAENLSPVMFVVAYGAAQGGLMQVHRPEVCYASSGFDIRDDRPAAIAVAGQHPIAAKAFSAVREDRNEQVLYWTRISNAFPRDLTEQRLTMLRLGLAGVIPDGVLVRLSTLGADRIVANATLQSFAAALISSAGPQGRALLLGNANLAGA